jgi:deoxyadenosine/deoxycytidine kinase
MISNIRSSPTVYETPLIISIEGNIGVGKTSLLQKMETLCTSKNYNIDCLYEPVKEWENVCDPVSKDSVLTQFYKEPAKYAFPFQIMAYSTQVQQLLQAVTKPILPKIVVTERSLESNHEVFTKMLYNDSMITDTSYQIYKMNANTHKLSYNRTPNLNTNAYIYLKSSPHVCMERIEKRQRKGECEITMDYLEKCHFYHENWLNAISPNRCYTIDMDDPNTITDLELSKIFKFMEKKYWDVMTCPPVPEHILYAPAPEHIYTPKPLRKLPLSLIPPEELNIKSSFVSNLTLSSSEFGSPLSISSVNSPISGIWYK